MTAPEVTLRYVGPFDEVELNVLPRDIGERWEPVKRGATVVVDARAAGRAPTADDPGDGFLAQPTNWELVPTTPAKPAKGDPA